MLRKNLAQRVSKNYTYVHYFCRFSETPVFPVFPVAMRTRPVGPNDPTKRATASARPPIQENAADPSISRLGARSDETRQHSVLRLPDPIPCQFR
jgi:hypothetical protein